MNARGCWSARPAGSSRPRCGWASTACLVTASGWKQVFAAANERCERAGVAVLCHPHLLRHSFAVVALEQLQRGHLAALAAMTAEQRGHYRRSSGTRWTGSAAGWAMPRSRQR